MNGFSEFSIEQTTLARPRGLVLYKTTFAPTITPYTPPCEHHNHNHIPTEANNP